MEIFHDGPGRVVIEGRASSSSTQGLMTELMQYYTASYRYLTVCQGILGWLTAHRMVLRWCLKHQHVHWFKRNDVVENKPVYGGVCKGPESSFLWCWCHETLTHSGPQASTPILASLSEMRTRRFMTTYLQTSTASPNHITGLDTFGSFAFILLVVV